MAGALASVIEANAERDSTQQMELMQTFADEAANEKLRDKEQSRMANADPLQKRNNSGGSTTSDKTGFKLGSHLAPLSRLEALTRVEGQYGSNNEPVSGQDRAKLVAVKPQVKGKIEDYSNVDELAAAFTSIGSAVHDNIDCLNTALARKDYHYSKVKTELTAQLVEKRKREEGMYLFTDYFVRLLLLNVFNRGCELVVHLKVSFGVLFQIEETITA